MITRVCGLEQDSPGLLIPLPLPFWVFFLLFCFLNADTGLRKRLETSSDKVTPFHVKWSVDENPTGSLPIFTLGVPVKRRGRRSGETVLFRAQEFCFIFRRKHLVKEFWRNRFVRSLREATLIRKKLPSSEVGTNGRNGFCSRVPGGITLLRVWKKRLVWSS